MQLQWVPQAPCLQADKAEGTAPNSRRTSCLRAIQQLETRRRLNQRMVEGQTEAERSLRALAEQRGPWSVFAKSGDPLVGKAVRHSYARSDLYGHLGTDHRMGGDWCGPGTKRSTVRRTKLSLPIPKLGDEPDHAESF